MTDIAKSLRPYQTVWSATISISIPYGLPISDQSITIREVNEQTFSAPAIKYTDEMKDISENQSTEMFEVYLIEKSRETTMDVF